MQNALMCNQWQLCARLKGPGGQACPHRCFNVYEELVLGLRKYCSFYFCLICSHRHCTLMVLTLGPERAFSGLLRVYTFENIAVG